MSWIQSSCRGNGCTTRGRFRQAGVRIHGDVQVYKGVYMAPGALIRATVRVREGEVDALEFTGAFTVTLAAALAALEAQLPGADTWQFSCLLTE